MCTIVPGTAWAAASTSDDPNADLIGVRSTITYKGVSRKPPPFASSPDRTPTGSVATSTMRVRGAGGGTTISCGSEG